MKDAEACGEARDLELRRLLVEGLESRKDELVSELYRLAKLEFSRRGGYCYEPHDERVESLQARYVLMSSWSREPVLTQIVDRAIDLAEAQ